MTKPDASEAIVSLLRRIDATPLEPIDLYRIGVPLIMEADVRYTETELLNGLDWLVSEKVIELPGNNTLRLITPLD
jgi:hypothetical protein